MIYGVCINGGRHAHQRELPGMGRSGAGCGSDSDAWRRCGHIDDLMCTREDGVVAVRHPGGRIYAQAPCAGRGWVEAAAAFVIEHAPKVPRRGRKQV